MKRLIVFLTILTMVFGKLGCAKAAKETSQYQQNSGDLTEFFINNFRAYGGKPKQTNDLSKILTQWHAKFDTNGFQILFEPKHKPEFEKMLETALGKPFLISKDNLMKSYHVRDVGSAVYCNDMTNKVHVICVKAQKF